MNLKIRQVNGGKYNVLVDDFSIGYIETYHNKFHSNNCYLKLNLAKYDNAISKAIFDTIYQQENAPLQIMLNSSDKDKIAFAESGGFVCKRKCYDIKVNIDDLIYKNGREITINHCQYGSDAYRQCAHLMYAHYKETHDKINRLTVSCEDFMAILPKSAYYHGSNTEISSTMFVEENEIAYLLLQDKGSSLDFAYTVIGRLFSKYNSIIFECDDVDNSAMKLASMFQVELNSSYNTYIKK